MKICTGPVHPQRMGIGHVKPLHCQHFSCCAACASGAPVLDAHTLAPGAPRRRAPFHVSVISALIIFPYFSSAKTSTQIPPDPIIIPVTGEKKNKKKNSIFLI